MAKRNSGLVYRKVDLHIHTPASHDYEDKDVTPEAIVEKALSEGLDAIAITDHNTGEFIDKIKEAARGKLIVFPGAEISSEGGIDGLIHIIALFDPSQSTHNITSFLGALEYKPKSNPEELYTNKSPNEVIDKIHERGGIAIPAHVNGDNGLLKDTRGNPRIDAIRNPRLLAVEATDCNDAEKAERRKRICDFLDGSDPNYRRELAVYQASDSHSLEKIGSRYSFFKMEEISLEGLRQCFHDPDVRIKQMDNLDVCKYPKITQLSVTQGFMKDQVINFHEGLNSIVGGKGVGKSLIIELIRFALDQHSKDSAISNDHLGKLKHKLEPSGEVHLTFELDNGETYQVCRKYDALQNPITCVNLTNSEPFNGDVSSIFPILAYSQNEIIKITEDAEAQLKLIDTFHDASSFYSRIKDIEEKLKPIVKEYSECINLGPKLEEAEKALHTLKEQHRLIVSSLENSLFKEMESLENKDKELTKHVTFHEELLGKLDEFTKDLEENFSEPAISEPFATDLSISEAGKLSQNSLIAIGNVIPTCRAVIESNQAKLAELYTQWSAELTAKREEYDKVLKDAGGDKEKLEAQRKAAADKIAQKESEISRYTQKVDKIPVLKENFNSLLDELDDAYNDYYNARRSIFESLSAQSNGRLNLEIAKAGNPSAFIEQLHTILKGTGIQKANYESIAGSIMPREFVNLVLQHETQSLAASCEISEKNANKIIENLNLGDNLEKVLTLCYSAYPKDVPSIQYLKDDGSYYPLDELSVGQKCTALLIIALSEGRKPIIIDQPEDSLDNPSIFEDIVLKLRSGKEKRQFILTTHNSNVGVASDSDNFVVIKGTASCCRVECSGAIDRQAVRSEVVDHLEGGKIPYILKSRKYGAN